MSPLRLTRIHVGDVHLDERYGHAGERIANCQTGMTVCACVDNRACHSAAQLMNEIDEFTLAVSLGELEGGYELVTNLDESPMNIVERFRAI